MSSPLSLLSLPEDILCEVLAHLLLDTPRSPTRTAILDACSLLHELGLPLLYRVVDLTGYHSIEEVASHWRFLFGVEGLFSRRGESGVGGWVRELRLGGERLLSDQYGCRPPSSVDAFPIPPLHLPNLTSLLIDLNRLPISLSSSSSSPPLHELFTQLSDQIEHLAIRDESTYAYQYLFPTSTYPKRLVDRIGLPIPARERRLKTISQIGAVFYDGVDADGRGCKERRFSFWDWQCSTVIIDLRAQDGRRWDAVGDLGVLLDPMADCSEEDQGRFLVGVERVELRVGRELEDVLRREVRRYEEGGLSEVQKRLFPVMVLVSGDGKETKLLV